MVRQNSLPMGLALTWPKKWPSGMAQWKGRCTTISSGIVNTPFFDTPKPDKLDPEDVADAVLYAVYAHPRNYVREVFLMPTN